MRRRVLAPPEPLQSLSLLMAAALPVLAPIEASAQYGRTSRTAPKLTSADIAIVRKLVRQDLTGKPKGTTLSWSNPESENSGTVTLFDSFESRGRDCRRVRYLINPGSRQPASVRPASYVLTNCRLPDGTWQIDKQAKR
jgi:surface antigen